MGYDTPDYCFTYWPAQRECFRRGALVDSWKARYPQIFDEEDVQLARNQPQNHFFEWLAAVLLYEATGFRSLIEGYVAKTNPQKRQLFAAKIGKEMFEVVDKKQSGLPDLFVYAPDSDEWFFCEVKGGPDRISDKQRIRFDLLFDETKKRVRVLQFNAFRP